MFEQACYGCGRRHVGWHVEVRAPLRRWLPRRHVHLCAGDYIYVQIITNDIRETRRGGGLNYVRFDVVMLNYGSASGIGALQLPSVAVGLSMFAEQCITMHSGGCCVGPGRFLG